MRSTFYKFRFTTPTTTTALRGDQQPVIDEDDIPEFYSIHDFREWSPATMSPIYRTDFGGLFNTERMSEFFETILPPVFVSMLLVLVNSSEDKTTKNL